MKTILITGSSRGIGKAIAQKAHKDGYKVILHGKSDSEELEKTHQDLPNSIKTFFDVSNKNETNSAMQILLSEVETINVLVNNSAIAGPTIKDINELDDEVALSEYSTNVLGPIHCIQALLPHFLVNKSGSVINIASIKGYPNLSTMSSLTYGGTKAAVISLTKALAKSYSEKGVRFNVVCPGYVETDLSKRWSSETWERINSGILLGRIAKPEEIANLVMFLASDESSYVTGSDFLIDGGYSLKGK